MVVLMVPWEKTVHVFIVTTIASMGVIVSKVTNVAVHLHINLLSPVCAQFQFVREVVVKVARVLTWELTHRKARSGSVNVKKDISVKIVQKSIPRSFPQKLVYVCKVS